MRTTIDIDPDLAATLKRRARERGTTFKAVVNAALRAGIDEHRPVSSRYQLPTRRMRLRPGVDLSHALALAADIEDAETQRELERRK